MKKILLLFIFLCLGCSNNEIKEQEIIMKDFTNKNISELKEFCDINNIKIDIDYEDNLIIDKDLIISQSIKEKEKINKDTIIKVKVSNGINKEKLKNDNINELGKVPIMMYHSIINMKDSETKNIGGNVDKDGYNRTTESFIRDLEFYYQEGYRMVKLNDYINGVVDVEYGKSPIILTFDDGNDNNIKVNGLDEKGNIIIDENSAVGILESFKKKYPDYNVTATFFVNEGLFKQNKYNDQILKWLVDNNYDIGNHTKGHIDISKKSSSEVSSSVGYIYDVLDKIIPDKYVKIVALPFGSPYNKNHNNFNSVLNSEYNGVKYETISTLRVGWEPEVSVYSKDFDKTFLKRCRAYDNNGVEFDIEMVFKNLKTNRFISDGIKDIITIKEIDKELLNNNELKVIYY